MNLNKIKNNWEPVLVATVYSILTAAIFTRYFLFIANGGN
jgi:hypothetical protein